VLNFLEEAGYELELELEDAKTDFFLPKARKSEKLMTIDGNYTESINYRAATAQTKAMFDADGVEIAFHSSWVGLSDKAMIEAQRIRGEVDHVVFDREYSEIDGKAFLDEECRFFVIEGERELFGDMLNKKLFDLETGERIDLGSQMHDQLYRTLESSVRCAAGLENNSMSEEEIDQFMNLIVNISESNEEDLDVFEQVEKANSRVSELILDNVFEAEALKEEV